MSMSLNREPSGYKRQASPPDWGIGGMVGRSTELSRRGGALFHAQVEVQCMIFGPSLIPSQNSRSGYNERPQETTKKRRPTIKLLRPPCNFRSTLEGHQIEQINPYKRSTAKRKNISFGADACKSRLEQILKENDKLAKSQ